MWTLFDKYDEWHAFVIGFSESLCPWPAKLAIPKCCYPALLTEYHYYSAGRAVGAFCLLAYLAAILKFFGV